MRPGSLSDTREPGSHTHSEKRAARCAQECAQTLKMRDQFVRFTQRNLSDSARRLPVANEHQGETVVPERGPLVGEMLSR